MHARMGQSRKKEGAMKLGGRVALVTGASRGIGREVALALGRAGALGLGRAGALVALVARDRGRLEAVAATIGREQSLVVPADLADLAQVRGAFDAVVARFGRVDVLVNNAG